MSRHFLILFVIAFALRYVALALSPPEIQFPDAEYFDQIADHIVLGNGAIAGPGAEAKRMPGYPYFLAACKKLTSGLPGYFHMVRISQAVIGSLSVCILFAFAGLWVRAKLAWVVAMLFALNPLHILFPTFLLSETLFSFFLVFGFYLLAKNEQHFLWRNVILAGFLFSLAVYTKESVFLLPLFAALMCGLFLRRRKLAGVFFAVFLLQIFSLTPWLLRNQARFHTPVLLTTHAGVTLYDSFNPNADGSSDFDKFDRLPRPEGFNEVQLDRWWRNQALDAIRRNPERVLHLAFAKAKRFWNLIPNHGGEMPSALLGGCFVYYLILDLLALLGILSLPRLRNSGAYFAVIPVFYFALLHMVFIGSLRYRLPVEPFLILLAGLGLESFERGRSGE